MPDSSTPQNTRHTAPETVARSEPLDAGRLAVGDWLRIARVYNLILRRLQKLVQQQFGCTLPQFDVLAQLQRSGRPLTFVELSRLLLVTSGNLTGIVDRLEKAGFAARQPDPSDRRVMRVCFTQKGRRLSARMVPAVTDELQEIMSTLDEKDQLTLNRHLETLRQAMGSL